MYVKHSFLTKVIVGSILLLTFISPVLAADTEKFNEDQVHQKKFHHFILKRLGKLSKRLTIQPSQQDAWNKYAKSVEAMANRKTDIPGKNTDAATISRFRADKALEYANGLAKVAEATAELQSVLSEDQRKILNQAARKLLQQDIKRKRSNMQQLYKQQSLKKKEAQQ